MAIQAKEDFRIEGSVLDTTQFNIRAEDKAHIFWAMRSGIYQNKVLAVIREYSTNAFDAHVEAGKKDVPIRITLPTRIDPIFKVRDFGNGLSHDDIREIFTCYGRSTKRDTNDQVGSLGLGSKSGFAYVNSWSLTSWHNGKKTMYEAYIDETGLGNMDKIIEVDSDEPSGVEIQITVDSKDITDFIETAKSFYPYFNPMPEFFGTVINPTKPSYNMLLAKTDRFELTHSDYYSGRYQNPVTIVMGNIPYQLQHDTQFIRLPDYCNLTIYAEIGEFPYTISRESLEMVPATYEKINSYIEQALEAYQKSLQETIDKMDSPWDVIMWIRGTATKLQSSAFNNTFTWRGKEYKNSRINFTKTNPELKLEARMYDNSRGRWWLQHAFYFSKDRPVVLLIDDGGFPRSQVKTRARKLLLQLAEEVVNKKYGSIYLIQNLDPSDDCSALKNWAELEGAQVYWLSEVTGFERGKSNRKYKKGSAFVWNGSIRAPYSDNWNVVDSLPKGKKVYVEIERYIPKNIKINGRFIGHKFNDFAKLMANLETQGIAPDKVYGVKKVPTGKDWISLGDYIVSTVEAKADAGYYEWLKSNRTSVGLNFFRSHAVFNVILDNKVNLTLISDPEFKEICEEYYSLSNIDDKVSMGYQKVSNLLSRYGLKIDKDLAVDNEAKKVVSDLKVRFNKLIESYPFLKLNYSYYGKPRAEEVAEYINGVYLIRNQNIQ